MAPHCIRILWFVSDVFLLIAAGGIGLVLLLDVGCEQAADFILNSLHQSAAHAICVHLAYELHMPGVGSLGLGRKASRLALPGEPSDSDDDMAARAPKGI